MALALVVSRGTLGKPSSRSVGGSRRSLANYSRLLGVAPRTVNGLLLWGRDVSVGMRRVHPSINLAREGTPLF